MSNRQLQRMSEHLFKVKDPELARLENHVSVLRDDLLEISSSQGSWTQDAQDAEIRLANAEEDLENYKENGFLPIRYDSVKRKQRVSF